MPRPLLSYVVLPLLTSIVLSAAAMAAPSTPTPPAKALRSNIRALASKDSLAAQAKVDEATARATALAKVPGGRVKTHELERENGLLIHSFDIAVPGRAGIEEVLVNALDGSVVSVKHEDAVAERREAKQDRAERSAARAARKAAKTRPAPRDSAKAR
jgi:hypothetical protein